MSLTEKNLSKFNKNKSSWSTESNSSFGSRKTPIIKPRGYGYQSDTTGLNHRKVIPPIGTLNSPPSSGDESTVKLNDIISRLNKQKKKHYTVQCLKSSTDQVQRSNNQKPYYLIG